VHPSRRAFVGCNSISWLTPSEGAFQKVVTGWPRRAALALGLINLSATCLNPDSPPLAMSSAGHPLPPSPLSSLTTSSFAADPPPPLPEIRSEQIRKRVFTHSSLPRCHKHVFQAPEDDPPVDNEELANCFFTWITG
jgi:hypothetical protein